MSIVANETQPGAPRLWAWWPIKGSLERFVQAWESRAGSQSANPRWDGSDENPQMGTNNHRKPRDPEEDTILRIPSGTAVEARHQLRNDAIEHARAYKPGSQHGTA